MKAVPTVNSRWHDDALEMFDDINIGIGTALGDKGLVVPVVHRGIRCRCSASPRGCRS